MEVIDAVEIVDSPFAGASAFVFVAEQQTALELPAHATERSGGKHAFRRSARSHVDIDVGVRRSEEHTSELQSLMRISYAVFCLKKKHKTRHQKRKYKQREDYRSQ